jgi:hypothetical protein
MTIDLVRYATAGPLGAYRGLIGERIERRPNGTSLVRYGGLLRDIDNRWLEPVAYWAISPMGVQGPYDNQGQAMLEIKDRLRGAYDRLQAQEGRMLPIEKRECEAMCKRFNVSAIPMVHGLSVLYLNCTYAVKPGNREAPPN